MSWDAVDSLDDAREATESLLFPLSWRTWLRLVVVTFFVGGVGGGGGAGQAAQGAVSSPSPPGATLDGATLPTIPTPSLGDVGTVLLAVVVVAVVLALGYAVVGAVMEFVLVESLRRRRVELRRPFRQFLVPGLRLFAFRALVLAGLFASAAVPLLLFVGVLPVSGSRVVLLPLLVAVAGLVWFAGVLVLRLTTDFVVPTMVGEGRTVLSAWRRFAPLCRAAWREVVLYLVVRLVLGAAAALVVGLAVGLGALVVALPFVLVGGAVVATVGLQGVGLVVLVALGAAFSLSVLLLSVVVQVPVVTYFRYYGLLLLGRLDGRLDLVRAS
ncbi:hypothetical protein C2R22_06305 [Salinigranum rubrum]|uniref:Glycerophosphoryl diester phosphodiesterase membrane domain-containing protein n=1 Tax=Salinigranum rubrum TaxID=755307 RepID=A0A2I8VHB8_9EURY|nr:hypothetical protein [Salinigranum rubrum]AUV81325.1 hypothetical protein C2R22_06305 [Salinigranum rubrum]